MEIKVTTFRQDGTQLYSGVMRAEDLVRMGKVDEYRQEGDTYRGYQRKPESARTGAVARYLKNTAKPLMPTSVLLSYRGGLSVDGDHITLPDDDTLYIIDGQHRIYGLGKAIEEMHLDRLRDYEIPVVIVENPTAEDEATQFRVINETMKKVRTDLARRLLALRVSTLGSVGRREVALAGRSWEVSAAEVIQVLSTAPDSPWVGRIQPPNSKKQPEHVIRELSFSTSLKPILNQSPYSRWPAARVAEKVKCLWLALRALLPEVFDSPQDHVLQKTPGVFSMHNMAFEVLEELRVNGITDPTVEDFKNILADLGEFATVQYWQNDNADGAAMAGSMKGFGLIADDMIEQLREAGKLTV